MKTILSFVFVFAFSLTAGFSQDSSKQSKKEARKEARQAKLEAIKARTLAALDEQAFVIEAHTLSDRYGYSLPVSPNTNFIAVDGEEAVIQLAFRVGPGLNGLGGVTYEGKVTKLEITERKKGKGHFLTMRIFGPGIGSVDIFADILADGGISAQVVGMNGQRFRYRGDFVPLEESFIYQGISLY